MAMAASAALHGMGQVANNLIQPFMRRVGGRNDDSRLVEDLDQKLEKAKDERRPYEGQWLVNVSFYMGKQWVIWSQALGSLDKPQVEPWRVMPNINHVRPAVLTSYSKIVKPRQVAKTQPGGVGPNDEKDARACDKLLDYLEPTTGSEVARSEAALWVLLTGTGLLKDCWDKSAGPVIGQDPVTGEDVHQGEIVTYSVSPFEFFGEPGCRRVEEMDWCFHVSLRPASYIKKMYNVDIEESEYDSSMTFETNLRSIISGDSSKTKGVVLKEFFRRPSSESPEGEYVVYANTTVVEEGPNPNKEDPIPFTKIAGNPRPDSFWGVSYVDDMIDPQRIYNKTKGELLEIQRLMSKPKHLIPIGALPQGKEISNAPGEDVRYNVVNGQKPEIFKGADIPEGYFKVMAETKQELFDTSGQHEVSHGQSPFTRTASGIAYLQEQDDARLAPIVRNYDRAFELSCEIKLRLARQYYDEQRTMTIIGEDNKAEVFSFAKDQIPDNIHVHIQAGGQALPRSRVARQDFLLKLWSAQPPVLDDPKMFLKLLEFGDVEGLYDDINRDISQAGRENDLMAGVQQQAGNTAPGQVAGPTPVPARDFNNHMVHIKEHNKLRNSVQYEQLPVPNQQAIDMHVAQHQQMYAQQVATMQANMAGAAGMKSETLGGNGAGGGGTNKPGGGGTDGVGPLFEHTGDTSPITSGLSHLGVPKQGGGP